jgi:methyltransferase (TIGR00027 family)
MKCLEKAGIAIPEQVTFIAVDLNDVPLKSALDTAGYENIRTLFLWEGVSYYLDPESVDMTFTFFSKSTHKESKLAFDYVLSITNENADKYFGARSFFQSMLEEHADEKMVFSLKEGEIETFLNQKGLYLLEHLNSEEIEKRYLIDDSGNLMDRITGHFRFAVAKPKNL